MVKGHIIFRGHYGLHMLKGADCSSYDTINMRLYISIHKKGRMRRAIDYPHLGAAGVAARGYLPEAEGEGQGDQYFPQAGLIGTNPALLLNKALDCFSDKHIYSSCNEAYRLTQTGELNVPPKYTDQYCNGPCMVETRHVLDCVHGIAKYFLFFNGATLNNVRDAISGGCNYGPKRGNFNVAEHIQADEDSAGTVPKIAFVYVFVLVIVTLHLLF